MERDDLFFGELSLSEFGLGYFIPGLLDFRFLLEVRPLGVGGLERLFS